MKDPAEFYQEYEDKMQREGLFVTITQHFKIERALYPGSYIHISPSFYIPYVVYVDTDKKAKKFFGDERYLSIIKDKKKYDGTFEAIFYGVDYKTPIPEKQSSFDLIISQYAGFVSQACKKYLKPNGLILANNSHGDAGVVSMDKDFELIGVTNYRNHKFYFSNKNLDLYFIPKKENLEVTKEYLLSLSRGIGYKKIASHYIFQKKG